MNILSSTIAVILCYLIGSIPTGYIIGKIIFKSDIRKLGSKNIGATNVFRTLGKTAGIFVLLFDILKGLICVLVIYKLFVIMEINTAKIICGLIAIVGHNWTIFLNFKGGKGVATSVGVFLALTPVEIGICFAVFLLIVIISRYVSLGSIISSLTFIILVYIFKRPMPIILFSIFTALIIVIKHVQNIKRLMKGTENEI